MNNNQEKKLLAPEVVNRLNELFNEEFPDIEKRLNFFVVDATQENGHWLIPVVDTVAGEPTIPSVEQLQTAFTLNPPGEVSIQHKRVPSRTILIRNTLTYEAATFASTGKMPFRHVMGSVVRDMIDEMRLLKGFDEDAISFGKYYATFKRPASDDVFRETDAGEVEIRLYSDTSVLPSDNNNKF